MPIAAILALLPSILTSITSLKDFFDKSMTTLKQSTELTPEQEAARDKIIADAEASPAWN